MGRGDGSNGHQAKAGTYTLPAFVITVRTTSAAPFRSTVRCVIYICWYKRVYPATQNLYLYCALLLATNVLNITLNLEAVEMLVNTGSLGTRKIDFNIFLWSCIGVLAVWFTWAIIYNVFFHPLSRFPGPTWGRFTRIPFWIKGLKGTQVYFIHSLHEKYGSVVRIAPDELSYTDAQAWKDIYGYTKGRQENPKSPGFQ